MDIGDLQDRCWFQFPEGTDPAWQAYWNAEPVGVRRTGPVVRTVHECLQAVLWNGSVGLTPLTHALPAGLVSVPLTRFPLSQLVMAWAEPAANPLVRAFTNLAAATYPRASGARGRRRRAELGAGRGQPEASAPSRPTVWKGRKRGL